ncbi:MAG TPA: HAMP domain-containing histidine kinase [Candidatus Blautia faecigallinarum]|uniref:histidine kinase n=1 Tax=Candidatus Blautia faecigallinarum TaxID=2838488 RepID=A0A9D2DVK7_9FIRM|nr:HAMP domain-containing histidine kinase [Candidatus Blautia faecigallinarum]
MDKALIVIGILCILGSFLSAVLMNRKQRGITERLGKMLEAAEGGRFQESGFDETVCSALESEMADYLNASEKSMNAAAAEKEKIKTLIADISHQTKTPIANLLLYTELLEEREKDPGNREYLTAIRRQTEKLDFLIRSLIKMSRLETGIVTLHPKEQDVKDMLAETAASYREKAEKKGLKLYDRSERGTAWFDRKWTAEAVGNILDNAVKYTEQGGIIIRTKRYELFTAVEVEDTGPGLLEEEIPEIFQRFRRGEAALEQEGVGIGLYLAREILAGEGGYIKVSSEKGKGSVFSLFLPNRKKENLSELS